MSVGAFSGVVAADGALQTCHPQRHRAPARGHDRGRSVCGHCRLSSIGIPVLRLQGDYLAIVTLAFGEIIKNIFNNLYVGVDSDGLHMSLLSDSDRPGPRAAS